MDLTSALLIIRRLQQQIIDVSFCSRIFTAGTNYGKVGDSELQEVEQLPGELCIQALQFSKEIGGFPEGSIGAEDVLLDHRIRSAGHRLWTDRSAIMWHRRRNLSRVRKQISNYGLVRALASNQHSDLRSWSHVMVALFPPIVIVAFAAFYWGSESGGLSSPWWDFSLSALDLGIERVSVLALPWLIVMYNLIAWYGSATGNSPNRTLTTIFLSPIVIFTLHWSYGIGVLRGRWRIFTGNPGLQIDDKNRAV